MTATQSTSSAFASRLRAAVEQDHGSVPAHRRARDWHGAAQSSVANPPRTRGLRRDDRTPDDADFATRLRRAVG